MILRYARFVPFGANLVQFSTESDIPGQAHIYCKAQQGCQIWHQNWGRLTPKWDKSVTFLNKISVYFRLPSQNVLKYELKKSQICPIWVSLTHFGPKSVHHVLESCKGNNKMISMMLREMTAF